MEMYGLTQRGIRIARNPRNPPTPPYKVIHFLDKVPRASREMIADYCGLSPTETSITLRSLKANHIIADEISSNI